MKARRKLSKYLGKAALTTHCGNKLESNQNFLPGKETDKRKRTAAEKKMELKRKEQRQSKENGRQMARGKYFWWC